MCAAVHRSALTPDANANVVRCFCLHSSSFILSIKGILPQKEPSLIHYTMLFIFSKHDKFYTGDFHNKETWSEEKSEERKNTFIVLCCCIVVNHAVL